MGKSLIVDDGIGQSVNGPVVNTPETLYAPIRVRKGPSGRRFSDEARNQEMIRRFRAGETSVDLSKAFGIVPSAVMSLLRRYGLTRYDGGLQVSAKVKRGVRPPKKAHAVEAAYRKHDCKAADFSSFEQFREARFKFKCQKSRAKTRGIDWQLTLGQWWAIWSASGKWEQRGRANAESAVMARKGDKGPYSVDNVYIITLAENFVESWASAPDRMAHRRGVAVHSPSVLFHGQNNET